MRRISRRQSAVGIRLLRNKVRDAVSKRTHLANEHQLLAFFVVYSLVFGVGYIYSDSPDQKGPQPAETPTAETDGRPARPYLVVNRLSRRNANDHDLRLSGRYVVFAATDVYRTGWSDPGVGILFPFIRDKHDRDKAGTSVAGMGRKRNPCCSWRGRAGVLLAYVTSSPTRADYPAVAALSLVLFAASLLNSVLSHRVTARLGINPLSSGQLRDLPSGCGGRSG